MVSYNMRWCVDIGCHVVSKGCGVLYLEIIRVFGMHNVCFVFHSHDGKGFFVR